jgi:hypothetical protein
LAIVKTCIESCRGTVACRNRRPSGLEVELRLEAAANPKAEGRNPKEVRSPDSEV